MVHEKMAMREFSRIAFDPAVVDLQTRIYEGLCKSYIVGLKKERRFRSEDILGYLEKTFGIKGLPQALIIDSLHRLSDEGYIGIEYGTWVTKSVPTRDAEKTDYLTKIVDELALKVEAEFGSVDAYQKIVIERSLERVLYAIFDELGADVTRILKGKESSRKPFPSVDRVVRDTFATFKEAQLGDYEKLRNATIKAIRAMFETQTPSFSEAIWRIGSTYVTIRILAADPELSKMRREAFKGGLLILDTNFVLDLICEGCTGHEAGRALLRSCMTLGFGILIQKSTEEELFRTIAKDTLRFKAQRSGYLDPAFAMRDIPRTYYENRSKFSDWYAYIAHLKLAYSDFLTEFKIEKPDYRALTLDPVDLAEASRVVHTQPSPMEKVKDRDAVEHDAVSLVAIQGLKASSSSALAGPWFLTRDNGILRASAEYARRRGDHSQAAIGGPALLQLVAPFLAGFVAENDLIETFSRMLRAEVVTIPEENVRAFVTYSFEQAEVEHNEGLLVSVVAEAHANRTFLRALNELNVPELLNGLTEAVQKSSVDAVELKSKELALERIMSTIKGSQKSDMVGSLTISSGLAKLVGDIMNKLGLNVHALGTPSRELDIHDAMATMLATLDYDFSHSKDSHDFAGFGVVPDFTVDINRVKIPIEIKFVDSEEKVPRVAEQMAADQTKYHVQYKSIVFVIYDLGIISDIAKFTKEFEAQGDIVLMVKH
jgi:predicted nucleic acid-binding protein